MAMHRGVSVSNQNRMFSATMARKSNIYKKVPKFITETVTGAD